MKKVIFRIKETHSDDDGHHRVVDGAHAFSRPTVPAIISFVLLISGIILEQTRTSFCYQSILIWFAVAYVLWDFGKCSSTRKQLKGIFSILLMSIAT
jgi:hypothetical protein